MHRHFILIFGLLAAAILVPSVAVAADSGFWQYPAIKSEGSVHPLPDAAFQPDSTVTYKAIFSLTKGDSDPKKVNDGLVHVARAVNVFASARIPLDHLKFVVIIHGGAVPAVLDNEHYRKEFKVDNPNLKLIGELKAAGVQIAVCGQAIAGYKYEYSWVNPDVKVALSALSTIIILQQQGYSLVAM